MQFGGDCRRRLTPQPRLRFARGTYVMPRGPGWVTEVLSESLIWRMRVMPRGTDLDRRQDLRVSSDACVSCLAAESSHIEDLEILFHPTHACHASRHIRRASGQVAESFIRRMRVMPRGQKERIILLLLFHPTHACHASRQDWREHQTRSLFHPTHACHASRHGGLVPFMKLFVSSDACVSCLAAFITW